MASSMPLTVASSPPSSRSLASFSTLSLSLVFSLMMPWSFSTAVGAGLLSVLGLLWLGGALDLRTEQLAMLVAMQDGDAGRRCRATMQGNDAGRRCRAAMQGGDAGRRCRTAMLDGELVLLCSSLWAWGSCRYSEFLVWVEERGTLSSSEREGSPYLLATCLEGLVISSPIPSFGSFGPVDLVPVAAPPHDDWSPVNWSPVNWSPPPLPGPLPLVPWLMALQGSSVAKQALDLRTDQLAVLVAMQDSDAGQ